MGTSRASNYPEISQKFYLSLAQAVESMNLLLGGPFFRSARTFQLICFELFRDKSHQQRETLRMEFSQPRRRRKLMNCVEIKITNMWWFSHEIMISRWQTWWIIFLSSHSSMTCVPDTKTPITHKVEINLWRFSLTMSHYSFIHPAQKWLSRIFPSTIASPVKCVDVNSHLFAFNYFHSLSLNPHILFRLSSFFSINIKRKCAREKQFYENLKSLPLSLFPNNKWCDTLSMTFHSVVVFLFFCLGARETKFQTSGSQTNWSCGDTLIFFIVDVSQNSRFSFSLRPMEFEDITSRKIAFIKTQSDRYFSTINTRSLVSL